MKALKTLVIAVALLGVSCFGTAAAINFSQQPVAVLAEGEPETSEPVESETTPASEEDVQSLKDKIDELEALVKTQADQIWNKELVSGLTIGGAILFAMEALLIIFRWKYGKKREDSYSERFSALQDKFNKLAEKCEQIQNTSNNFLEQGCNEMNALKNECSELLKEVKAVMPQLKQYEQFNQRLVAVINILDTISFTPENVKNGVAEKVKKLVEEVK